MREMMRFGACEVCTGATDRLKMWLNVPVLCAMWGCSLSLGSDVAGGRFEVAEHDDERQARELLTKVGTVFDAPVLHIQMSFQTYWFHRLLLLSAATYVRESLYNML